MRRFAAIAVILIFTASASAVALAADGKVYGSGVAAGDVVAVSELIANPAAYVGKTVRVEGLITEVCPKRGCWMNLAGDKEFQTVRIKVDDGVIVFPLDAKGKHAVAEGVFTKMEITPEKAVEHAKHLAEEKGEKFDPAKAKDLPTVVYQIQGTGAVIR